MFWANTFPFVWLSSLPSTVQHAMPIFCECPGFELTLSCFHTVCYYQGPGSLFLETSALEVEELVTMLLFPAGVWSRHSLRTSAHSFTSFSHLKPLTLNSLVALEDAYFVCVCACKCNAHRRQKVAADPWNCSNGQVVRHLMCSCWEPNPLPL